MEPGRLIPSISALACLVSEAGHVQLRHTKGAHHDDGRGDKPRSPFIVHIRQVILKAKTGRAGHAPAILPSLFGVIGPVSTRLPEKDRQCNGFVTWDQGYSPDGVLFRAPKQPVGLRFAI